VAARGLPAGILANREAQEIKPHPSLHGLEGMGDGGLRGCRYSPRSAKKYSTARRAAGVVRFLHALRGVGIAPTDEQSVVTVLGRRGPHPGYPGFGTNGSHDGRFSPDGWTPALVPRSLYDLDLPGPYIGALAVRGRCHRCSGRAVDISRPQWE
jgi:hypothetical protein